MIHSILLGALAAVLGSLALPLHRYRRLPYRPRLAVASAPVAAPAGNEAPDLYARTIGAAIWLCRWAPPPDEPAARLALTLLRASAWARGIAVEEPTVELWPRDLSRDLCDMLIDTAEHPHGERLAPMLGQAIGILGELAERPWVRREILRVEP